jgi:hypothetical protein
MYTRLEHPPRGAEVSGPKVGVRRPPATLTVGRRPVPAEAASTDTCQATSRFTRYGDTQIYDFVPVPLR